ncbi:MAG: class I SAM-dependent RNA methyltransferase, partial [Bacteroidota bacterium]
MQIAVRCLQGFEFLLKQELEQLGVTELKEGNRVVQGSCELVDLYKVNYCSRLALRVLVPVHAYSFASIDEFYLNALNFAWEEWLDEDTTFAIDPQVSSMQFRHAHFASLKLKDAIADRLRKVYGSRPNVDTENPNVQIHLLVNRDRVQISMDSSGRSLNQRGYRKSGGEAPMNEVLAAGMIRQSGWRGEK